MATPEYIRLYDLRGNLTAILENAYNIVIEEKLGDAETLSFSIPFLDNKSQYIEQDEEIIYTGKRYIITKVEDGRDETGKEALDVICECCYIELLNFTKHGEFLIDRRSVKNGLEKILQGTAWTIGTIEGDVNGIYSLKENDKTVLWLVRQWAKITGLEIKWDSLSRKVNFLSAVGTNRGAGFRYKKNLKSIKRTIIPPEATVIYPHGRNNLNIKDVNNGIEYLEDYSFYISKGLSLTEAKAHFKKEYIWTDDRFILPENLKDAAEKKLSELSQPKISYECSILDLSTITGLSEDKFFIGDIVKVYDSELKINIQNRILRLKRYPQQPWRNEVELAYIIPGLQDAEEESISSEVASSQPSMLFGSNAQPLSVTTTQQYPISLSLTNFSSTNAQFGLMIVGQASTTLALTVKFFLGGVQIGPTIQQICQTGWNTIGVPFILAQIPAGSAFFDVNIATDTGTFSIAANHMQIFIYATNLLGGLSPEIPRANWQEPVQLEVVIPASEIIQIVNIPMYIEYQENVILDIIPPDININIILA